MKKKMRKHLRSEQLIPQMEWQTGDYSRQNDFSFTLPYQFLILCRLVGISPREILGNFINNLSCGSWKREGKELSRQKSVEYFFAEGYGNEKYSSAELLDIFKEMDAIGMLYPREGEEKLIDLHSAWRKEYHRYLYNKWNRDHPANTK